jgi:NitT/TauT family transport system substrate-binding protein
VAVFFYIIFGGSMKRILNLAQWIIVLCLLITLTSCQTHQQKLRIGIIKPSVNHFPLSFAYQRQLLNPARFELISFSSGWEAQEAIAAGKLDAAILPFTYVWTLQSKGHQVKTLSCLERETDALVTKMDSKDWKALPNPKIGLLRASSLEALLLDYAQSQNLHYKPVYFRSPAELTEALRSSSVDAIVCYEPLISKMGDTAQVVHWFADNHPNHPCCNLVASQTALNRQSALLTELQSALHKSVEFLAIHPEEAIKALSQSYQLTAEQAEQALAHVKYDLSTSTQDKVFERSMMQTFIQSGYLKTLPADSEIYQ